MSKWRRREIWLTSADSYVILVILLDWNNTMVQTKHLFIDFKIRITMRSWLVQLLTRTGPWGQTALQVESRRLLGNLSKRSGVHGANVRELFNAIMLIIRNAQTKHCFGRAEARAWDLAKFSGRHLGVKKKKNSAVVTIPDIRSFTVHFGKAWSEN